MKLQFLGSILLLISNFAVGGTVTATPKCELCSTPSPLGTLAETPWLSARKPIIVDSVMVNNQNDAVVDLKNIFDRPTAITFIYTRCDNPNKCPLVVSAMIQLREKLKDAGLQNSIRLCIITYDPEHDSPSVLRAFAVKRGIACDENFMLLQPKPLEKKSLFEAMNVVVNYNGAHVNIHDIQLLLLDKSGRLAKSYHTLVWDNKKVMEDLKRLSAEEMK